MAAAARAGGLGPGLESADEPRRVPRRPRWRAQLTGRPATGPWREAGFTSSVLRAPSFQEVGRSRPSWAGTVASVGSGTCGASEAPRLPRAGFALVTARTSQAGGDTLGRRAAWAAGLRFPSGHAGRGAAFGRELRCQSGVPDCAVRPWRRGPPQLIKPEQTYRGRRCAILIFGACDRIILVICRIYLLLKVLPKATLIGREANSLFSSCQSLFYLLRTAETYLHNNEDKSPGCFQHKEECGPS